VDGRKITYIDITEDTTREGLKQIGMDDWFINLMMELFRTIRGGYGSETTEGIVDTRQFLFDDLWKRHACRRPNERD
jgi:hypothetical protein